MIESLWWWSDDGDGDGDTDDDHDHDDSDDNQDFADDGDDDIPDHREWYWTPEARHISYQTKPIEMIMKAGMIKHGSGFQCFEWSFW